MGREFLDREWVPVSVDPNGFTESFVWSSGQDGPRGFVCLRLEYVSGQCWIRAFIPDADQVGATIVYKRRVGWDAEYAFMSIEAWYRDNVVSESGWGEFYTRHADVLRAAMGVAGGAT